MRGSDYARGFTLSLILALAHAHAGLDFRQELFCFWSINLTISNMKVEQDSGSSVTLKIDQRLNLRTKTRLSLTSSESHILGDQRFQFKARNGTVWEDLGRNRGQLIFEDKKPNAIVKEAHVSTGVPLRLYLHATNPTKMARDANVKACRTKFLWDLVYTPLRVPGCKFENIAVNFVKSDNTHIRDIIHINGTESRMISNENGGNTDFKVELEMDVLSDNVSQCSLVRNGDYCQGVLNGETKFQYVNEEFIKKALSFFAGIPTCFALFKIIRQGFPNIPPERSPLMTLLLENIYGAIFFVAFVFMVLPVHDHAIYQTCEILWQPSLLSGAKCMAYCVYQPFLIISPLLFISGYMAMKAGYIKLEKLLENLIITQSASALFQIWFGLYWFVIYRDIGQCFNLIVMLTIVQTLLTYYLGSNKAVQDEDDTRPHGD